MGTQIWDPRGARKVAWTEVYLTLCHPFGIADCHYHLLEAGLESTRAPSRRCRALSQSQSNTMDLSYYRLHYYGTLNSDPRKRTLYKQPIPASGDLINHRSGNRSTTESGYRLIEQIL